MIEIHFQLTQKGIYWLMKVASTLPAFRTEGVNLYCDHPGCGVCYASPSRLTRTRALSRHLALRATLPLGSKAATGPHPTPAWSWLDVGELQTSGPSGQCQLLCSVDGSELVARSLLTAQGQRGLRTHLLKSIEGLGDRTQAEPQVTNKSRGCRWPDGGMQVKDWVAEGQADQSPHSSSSLTLCELAWRPAGAPRDIELILGLGV